MFHDFVWLVLSARCWSARLWTPRLKARHLRGRVQMTVWSGCNSGLGCLGEDRLLFHHFPCFGWSKHSSDWDHYLRTLETHFQSSPKRCCRRTTDTDHFATQGNCYFKRRRGFTIRFLKYLTMQFGKRKRHLLYKIDTSCQFIWHTTLETVTSYLKIRSLFTSVGTGSSSEHLAPANFTYTSGLWYFCPWLFLAHGSSLTVYIWLWRSASALKTCSLPTNRGQIRRHGVGCDSTKSNAGPKSCTRSSWGLP